MPPRLIVIVSSPRSGSTWVAKLFDSHPLTIYRHEADGEGRLTHVPLFPAKANFPALAPLLSDFASALPRIHSPRVVAKFPLFPKAYDRFGSGKLRASATGMLKLAAVAGGKLPVPQFIGARAYAAHPIVWKSIESTGRLGLLSHAMPEARILHLIRHPCGYVSSALRGMRSGNLTEEHDEELWEMFAATDVAKSYGIDLAALRAMSLPERLAWTWVIENEKALIDSQGAGNVRILRYEDVCARPLSAIEDAFTFAGLPMDVQVREFARNSTRADNNAYYSVFKDPQRSAYKWQSELATAVIDRVQQVAAGTQPGQFYANAVREEATSA